MDNKTLGVMLVVIGLVLGGVVYTFNEALEANTASSCSCTDNSEGGSCPHQEVSSVPNYLGLILVSFVVALGAYLVFFEKSQKEIVSTLKKQKEMKVGAEKFGILLKGMSKGEQKVMKAVKEQDGISQNTLRLRTDLHKSKLSIVLKDLEDKGLIKKVRKGKSNQIFLKIKL